MASPDFNNPGRIIRAAMDNAGLLAAGDDPTPEQYVKYINRLNDLVNLWQTQGIKLFLNTSLVISLFANNRVYQLPGNPKRVLEAYYQDVNNITRPLMPMSWNTYFALSTKTVNGPVNSYFIDKQATTTLMSLWQVPDAQAATGTIVCTVQNPVNNVVILTDNMGFPNEWYIALHWGLAAEICTGQPEQIVQRCERRAAQYLKALEDWDVEDAPITFSPNSQHRRPSSFR